MKTARRKRAVPSVPVTEAEPQLTTFSSDLLTPEEERELLTSFWECKTDLVRVLIRHFSDLRVNKPPLEPWPMAQFIRDNCLKEQREVLAVRRLHDRYVHFKHRLASANIRLAAHVAKRFRHHSLRVGQMVNMPGVGIASADPRQIRPGAF